MKVLIPVQDDVFGDAITDMITRHQWSADTEFRLITVIEYGTYGEMLGELYCCDTTRSVYSERERTAKYLLERYAGKLDAAIAGACIEEQVVLGQPKEMILQQAEEWGADIIVMGSHARRGLSRFLLGSVSMAVLSQAPCSVIIVKVPKEIPNSKTAATAAVGTAQI